MPSMPRILLLGATGETGSSILDGLLEANKYNLEVLVRPSSVRKEAVKAIQDRGVKLRVTDLSASEDELALVLSGIDILISAISGYDQLSQKTLMRAAKIAGIRRVVPCAYGTIAPPQGVMLFRDEKEEVYNEIKRLALPYTIIEVGFWHQLSFPRVSSGRLDYAVLQQDSTTIYGDGNMPNILSDLRDVGQYVSRIIDDDRTLNKHVYGWSDVLTANETFAIVEELSGEIIEKEYVSSQQLEATLERARAEHSKNPKDPTKRLDFYILQTMYSKYVRGDNQPSYAKYLGYLDARQLYPDFKPISFRDFLAEAFEGKAKRPYAQLTSGASLQH
ncbi:hypothetical protein BDV38DRAFT_234670 [Aspergillus pseudotamarii]|uniref:NmrA-like domain-containing protein n=1 Tax=Aspergillus pseudotamarii TaxID=132259 RepID=A0A5N6T9N9_ASPPS|nr:uncharacterized protein BDV38DRAFT_234670 [Aspergillus pseudotamarii]KAE8143088.1 hypothetical protein BDV38DRAFT_234670 [Aspergillus pseudotamarii]